MYIHDIKYETDYSTAQILTKRLKAYEKYKLPKELGTARVSLLAPLTFHADQNTSTNNPSLAPNGQCYGFAFVDGEIMVAKGA